MFTDTDVLINPGVLFMSMVLVCDGDGVSST